jgi:CheY-like chemotaxis protein
VTKSVLIVEDDEGIRMSLQELLESEGYVVRTARHGGEALESLRRDGAPSIILLDLMMPHVDGVSFRDQQRAAGLHVEVPVVVMSAHADMASQRQRLGAQMYLEKPLEIDTLLDAMTATLRAA